MAVNILGIAWCRSPRRLQPVAEIYASTHLPKFTLPDGFAHLVRPVKRPFGSIRPVEHPFDLMRPVKRPIGSMYAITTHRLARIQPLRCHVPSPPLGRKVCVRL